MRGDDVSENFKIQLLFDRNNSSISLFIVLQYGEFKSSIVNDARRLWKGKEVAKSRALFRKQVHWLSEIFR